MRIALANRKSIDEKRSRIDLSGVGPLLTPSANLPKMQPHEPWPVRRGHELTEEVEMLLHGEQYWLMGYFALVIAAVIASIATGLPIWGTVLIAIGGSIVSFYGWLFQVGRFG